MKNISKRYCNNCATAFAQPPGPGHCPACGHPYSGERADETTLPEHTLVTDMGEETLEATVAEAAGVGLGQGKDLQDATTVIGQEGGPGVSPNQPAGARATATAGAEPAAGLDIEALRAGLGGRFEIQRQVGAGGMGQVFAATDLSLQRKVAIKCITPELGAHPEWVERLRHEARIVARLQHPQIVQVFEIIELGGHSLMVMEYIEGRELRSAVRGGDLDRSQLLELIGEACAAVAFAHGRGVIHRDIKPGNIMVSADGHCKIMDFGIAGLADDTPEPGSTLMAGSLAYMAPELLERGGQGDTRSDVYAFGVTLYYALTGKLPFRGARGTALAAQIREGHPAPPRELDPSISKDLEAVCLKAMHHNPAQRYGGCDELAEDLRRARLGLRVSARQYPLAVQIRLALVRHPLSFALALGVALLLFAGIFLSASHVHRVAEDTTVRELEDKVRNVAYAITVLMPGDRIGELHSSAVPGRERLAFLDTAILKIKDFNPDIRDAYLVLPESPGRYRVALAWHGSHAGKATPPVPRGPTRGHDTWGKTASVDNAEAETFIHRALGGEILVQHETDTDVSIVNEWRDRLLGYAPIRELGGEAVAVLVIEVSSEALIAAFRQIENAFQLTLLFGALLSFGLLLLAVSGLVLLWRQAR